MTGNNHHIDDPIPPQYNLRMRATNVINSEILEETPNVTSKGKCGQKGTDTIKLIKKHEVPGGCKATYARIVVDYRPQKLILTECASQ
eukprot:6901388-Ditylum_brightwellii.AAC.1